MLLALPYPVALFCLAFPKIIASASNVYAIPWPPAFQSLLSALRVFLVDIVSITRTNCAQPMNYYSSMLLVLLGVKGVLALLLLGPWLWNVLQRSSLGVMQRLREHRIQRRVYVKRYFRDLSFAYVVPG